MKDVLKKILLAACLVGLIVAVRLLGLDHLLSLEAVQRHRQDLEAFVQARYAAAVLVFIAVYVMVVALSIPAATVLTLTGGFLFGMLSALYVNVGATAGATLAFLAARYLVGDWVQRKYGDRLAAFNREFDQSGANYLLSARLIPAIPFFLVNFLSGLTRVSPLTFAWTTAVGIIPGSLVYTFAGRELGTMASTGSILTGQMVLALVLLGALSLVPVVVRKLRGAS